LVDVVVSPTRYAWFLLPVVGGSLVDVVVSPTRCA
jgi:hypothetical protein